MSADLFNNSLSLSLPPHSLTFIRKKDGLLFTAHKNMLVTQQVLKTMKSKWMIITFVWKSVIFLCQNNYIVAVPSLFAFFFHLTNGRLEVGWAECVCVCVCVCAEHTLSALLQMTLGGGSPLMGISRRSLFPAITVTVLSASRPSRLILGGSGILNTACVIRQSFPWEYLG